MKGLAMCARSDWTRSLCGIVSAALMGAACVGCGQPSNDLLYSTAGPEGKLMTFDIRDVNKVTTTVVGLMGTEGCASLARSSSGVLYSICGPGILRPGQPQKLSTIDPKTGRATMFGSVLERLQVMGLEFAPDGMLYAVGDANQASPTFNSLYTVDVTSGAFTRVGSTGAPEFFMDFAFDRIGTMYGATSHTLFTIDRKSGTATKVVDFVGGGDVMGLTFNEKQDTLYATDFKMPVSALYRVDLQTGFLTPLAAVGYPFAHGLVPAIR